MQHGNHILTEIRQKCQEKIISTSVLLKYRAPSYIAMSHFKTKLKYTLLRTLRRFLTNKKLYKIGLKKSDNWIFCSGHKNSI